MIFLLFAIFGFFIHWLIRRKGALGILLNYLVFFCLGVAGIVAFLVDLFYPNDVAQLLGWSIASPFQFQTGVANLSFGVLAIFSVWLRGGFMLATLIGNSIWLWGTAFDHLSKIGNDSGVYFWVNVWIPVLIWIVFLLNNRFKATN